MNADAITPNTGIHRLSVRKLFGRFDYDIDFTQEEQIVILTAPNGFGKTILLRIIHNFLSVNFIFFRQLPFETIDLMYVDGSGVHIAKSTTNITTENDSSPEQKIIFSSINTSPADEPPYEYNSESANNLYQYLERRLPVQRLDQDRWINTRTASILSTTDVINLFGDTIPDRVLKPSDIPPWLASITDRISSHFIATQRLISFEAAENSRHSYGIPELKSTPVVETDAIDLANKIKQVVSAYATQAQRLDQSFPKRIIDGRNFPVTTRQDILERLANLAKKRRELVNAGLMGQTEREPHSNPEDLDDENILRILSIYISDTEEKLDVFSELYERVELFTNIVNGHFVFKGIEVNQIEGFSAYDYSTGNQIRLADLSSGEQHMLVLVYELLFVVEEGAVILIDEPELSLHVGWQREFINDIIRIQSVRNIQFIIATHSPQIIDDHWHTVRELSINE